MLRLLCIGLISWLLLLSCQNQAEENKSVQILFVGDLLLDRGVKEKIEHLGADALFHSSIDSIFGECNYVVANLECPATTINEPINKRFIFRADPDLLAVLKQHGISHLNMANNHSMDQGRAGLVDTEKNILKSGIVPLGFGNNVTQACKAKLIATTPRKIYILSSLQVPSENWIYLENKPCVCEQSFNSIAKQVSLLKKSEPNSFVIIQLHWGIEHTSIPLTSQKQNAYMLIDAGADCIIGHHSHSIQVFEYYSGKPVFYGIGNFIFDQTKPINSEGLMVKLTITENNVQFNTIRFEIEKCTPRVVN